MPICASCGRNVKKPRHPYKCGVCGNFMCSKCFFIEGDFCSAKCREIAGDNFIPNVQQAQIDQQKTTYPQQTIPTSEQPVTMEPSLDDATLENLLDSLIEEDLSQKITKPEQKSVSQPIEDPHVPTYQQLNEKMEYQFPIQNKPTPQPSTEEYQGTFKQVESQIDYKPTPPKPQTNLFINEQYSESSKQIESQVYQPPNFQQKDTNLLAPESYMGESGKEIESNIPGPQLKYEKNSDEQYVPSFLQINDEVEKKLQNSQSIDTTTDDIVQDWNIQKNEELTYDESELTYKKIDAMMEEEWKDDKTIISGDFKTVKKKIEVPTNLTFEHLDPKHKEILDMASGKAIFKKAPPKIEDTARYVAEDWLPVQAKPKSKGEIKDDYKDEIKDFIPYKPVKKEFKNGEKARNVAEDYLPYKPIKKEVSEDYKDEIKDFIPEEYQIKRKLDITDSARYQAEDQLLKSGKVTKSTEELEKEYYSQINQIKDYIPEEVKETPKKKAVFEDIARYAASDYLPEDAKKLSKKQLEEKFRKEVNEIEDYVPIKTKKKEKIISSARYAAEDYIPYKPVDRTISSLNYGTEINDYVPEEFKSIQRKVVDSKKPTFLKVDKEKQKEWEESGLISEVEKSESKSYFDQMKELSKEKGVKYVGFVDEKGEERIFQLEIQKPKEGLLTERPYQGRSKEAEMERYKQERMKRIELYELLMVIGETLFHPVLSEDYFIKKEKQEKLQKIKDAPTFLKLDRDLSEDDLKKIKKIEKEIEKEEKEKNDKPKLL